MKRFINNLSDRQVDLLAEMLTRFKCDGKCERCLLKPLYDREDFLCSDEDAVVNFLCEDVEDVNKELLK